MAFSCGLRNVGEPATVVETVTVGFVTGVTVTSVGFRGDGGTGGHDHWGDRERARTLGYDGLGPRAP